MPGSPPTGDRPLPVRQPATPVAEDGEAGLGAVPAPDLIAVTPARGVPSDVRIFIHYTGFRDEDRRRAMKLAQYLQARGINVAEIRDVDFPIRNGSVRYFFPKDRQGSEAVTRTLSEFYAWNGEHHALPRQPQDLTTYERKPSNGTIEVWLPSR